MKRVKIGVIGSYLAGLTMRLARFPAPGETLIGSGYRQFHGGKGANQAVGCARLGAEARFAGCVGRDALGEAALRLFREEGVDASAVIRCESAPTGVGFILVDGAGENVIALDLGACREATPSYVDALPGAFWQDLDMVLCQLEVPVETVLRVGHIARARGIPMLLNPAPWQPLPRQLFPLISALTPNETEARALLNPKGGEGDQIDEWPGRILGLGVERVALTRGANGVSFAENGGLRGHSPAFSVPVLDTTGAGDAFTAGLAVALCEGMAFPEAIAFAQRAASCAVQRYGVIESLPYRGALQ